MNLQANFSIEKIDNGYIIRHEQAARAVHVGHHFMVARQIEQFMHDAAVEAIEERVAIEAEHASSVAAMQVEV